MHPILLELGPLTINTYGFLIAAGGALTSWFWVRKAKQMGLRSTEDAWLVINGILAGGFLGGRVLHLLEYESLFSPGFWRTDRKSTRLNSSHIQKSRMPSSA